MMATYQVTYPVNIKINSFRSLFKYFPISVRFEIPTIKFNTMFIHNAIKTMKQMAFIVISSFGFVYYVRLGLSVSLKKISLGFLTR